MGENGLCFQNRRDFIVLYYVIYSVANYIINKQIKCLRFQDFIAASIDITDFWDITLVLS
jgi:hypothetical protein